MTTNELSSEAAVPAAINQAESPKRRPLIPGWLKGAAQIIIGAGALTYLVVRSSPGQLVQVLHSAKLVYLPLSLLAILASYWLMAYRWKVILSARTHSLSTRDLFIYYLIGSFFSNFVPGGSLSVDVVRTLYAGRVIGDRAYVVMTLLYDRLIGLFALLLIGLGSALASRQYLPAGTLVHLFEIVLAGSFLISAFLMSELVSDKLAGTVIFIAKLVRLERLGRGVAGALRSMSEIRSRKSIIVSTLFASILIRVLWSLGFYLIAVSLSLNVGLVIIFAFTSIVDLIRQLPITPNGLGLREGLLVLLLGEVGVPQGQALMFSLLGFGLVLLLALVGGVIYTLRGRILKDPVK